MATEGLKTIARMRSRSDQLREAAQDLNSLIASVTSLTPNNSSELEMDTGHTTGFERVTLNVEMLIPKATDDVMSLMDDPRWETASMSKTNDGYRLRLEARFRVSTY